MKIRSKDSLHRTNTTRNRVAIAAAAFAGLSIASSVQAQIAAPGFNNGAGAGANQWTLNAVATTPPAPAGVPGIASDVLTITTNVNNEGTSAWYNTAQSLDNFTAQFTYTFVNGTATPADGFTFALQNDSLTAVGNPGGSLGYLGNNLGNTAGDKSVALAFDLWNGQNTANPRVTRTGFGATGYGGIVYQGTDPFNLDLAAPAVVLSNTTPISIKIDYNNGVFTRTLTQGTNTVVRTQNLNLADRIGGSAFVGFTGGTGGANATQTISGFSLTPGTAPAVPAAATVRTDVPQGAAGNWGIREVFRGAAGTAINTLADAEAAIGGTDGTVVEYNAPTVNLYDSGGRGRFRSDTLYKSDPDQATPGNDTVNNIAVISTATMLIPTSGVYSFGVNSDDGFRMTIDGRRFEAFGGQFNGGINAADRTKINPNGALEFAVGRGVNDSIGTIYLPAGEHKIQVLAWEGGGGGATEVWAASGGRQGFDYTQFSLLGSAGVPARSGFNRVGATTDWNYTPYTNANNVTEVITAGRGGGGTPVAGTTVQVPTVNFADPQGLNVGSHGADDVPFPGDTAGDDNAFGGYATMTLTITEPNIYTFMMYTDDDSRFSIKPTGGGAPLPLVGNVIGDAFDSDGDGVDDTFGLNGCCSDHFGHYNLAAGTYNIEAAFHEGGGGSGFFIYATQGERDNFNAADFQLLGADTNGAAWSVAGVQGIQLVPEPASIGLLGLAAVGLMARRRRPQA